MYEAIKNTGLYWQPLGGNNIDQISGHCYRYTDVIRSNGKRQSTTILVDLGKFDNHQALGIQNSAAAVPDIRDILSDKEDMPKALFLTHSHPDHLNGIIHYLKAGYKLPSLYAGKYTFMILYDLLQGYHFPQNLWPKFNVIEDGSRLSIGSLEIEVLASSHTCFDSLGLIIKSPNAVVYHTGDMKLDQTTYFRPPTNIKRLRELAPSINAVVADFYGIYSDGFALKEADTLKCLVKLIRKSRKSKIFLPVYPTHPEMYITAFLAALKLKKNVVFYGNTDFFGYLKMIIEYGISFEKMAEGKIVVSYSHNEEEVAKLNDDYVVIGTYNHIPDVFNVSKKDCYGIITAKTFFNPLKGQLNLKNIKFATVDDYPELQGYGHGFFGDYEELNNILGRRPVFLPTHCPTYMIDDVRELASYCGLKIVGTTPKNNQIYRIKRKRIELVSVSPAKWLVVIYNSDDFAYMAEVFQKPTSGHGFLKRTISRRRCQNRFKSYLQKRINLNRGKNGTGN